MKIVKNISWWKSVHFTVIYINNNINSWTLQLGKTMKKKYTLQCNYLVKKDKNIVLNKIND